MIIFKYIDIYIHIYIYIYTHIHTYIKHNIIFLPNISGMPHNCEFTRVQSTREEKKQHRQGQSRRHEKVDDMEYGRGDGGFIGGDGGVRGGGAE
jgi:hypothetical protein